jgi:hypothetical protein
MTITTEEAEEMAKGAFMLMDDPPDPDDEIMLGSDFLTDLATALCSLAAERDALKVEIARMKEVLERLARLGNEPLYGNSDGNIIARAELERLSRVGEKE